VLNHGLLVGVQRTWKRGCRASHFCTFACLCVASLSAIRWIPFSAGVTSSMALPLVAHADDGAVEGVQRRKQCHHSVALVVVGRVPQRPFLSGKPGCIRSRAWICLLSSAHSTIACSGGFK
jgi:hypothetical protein